MITKTRSRTSSTPSSLPHLPFYIPLFNHVTRTLLRLGLPMSYVTLLTVQGRKTGKPRRNPVGLFRHDGKRYLFSTFGDVNWVRNLRTAKQAKIRRNWRNKTVYPVELSQEEAAIVLQKAVAPAFQGLGGKIFREHFSLKPDAPFSEFLEETMHHPVFELRENPIK